MIWLTGNKGMLGSDIEILLEKNKLDYMASDREVDITNINEIEDFVSGKEISWIINSAAYTAVDKAQEETQKAFLINSFAVKNLAQVSKKRNINLIHISTDYVFDGNKNEAYKEDDLPNPQNIYGRSKLKAEEYIKETLESYFILRTAWLFGKNGKNFVNAVLNLFKVKKEIKIVNDQFGSPTYTKDLVELIIKIIKDGVGKYGIYHFTNDGIITWYVFAQEIYRISREINLLKNEVTLIPITTKEYPTPARRPKYSVLSKEKIKREMNLKIRDWKDSLMEYLLKLKECEN